MKQLIIAACLMLAAGPYALAQDKAKDVEKKAPVAERSVTTDAAKGKGDEKKSAMAAEKSATTDAKGKGDEKNSAMAKEKSEKRQPTQAQKAHETRMKDCAAKAGDRKGDERKKFMSECLSKS
jgi:hypothetical protein